MDTFKSIIQKINKATEKAPIFYISNDPERALGLESYLTNYHMVCIDHTDIVDNIQKDGRSIFSLEKSLAQQNLIFRNSARLLRQPNAQSYILDRANKQKGYFMFFKISPRLERITQKYSFKPLNTAAKLNRKFELKISQYREFSKLDISFPKTVIAKLKELDYDQLKKKLADVFVIQFDRGHTGAGTIITRTNEQLDNLKKRFPKRTVRVSEFIEGDPYTLNACVTKTGTIWGGLSFQITGIPECTSKKGATVGNDWKHTENLPQNIRKEISDMTIKIGDHMAQSNFKGLFGIDLIIQRKTGKPYFVEVNARQPASIPMHTKLQIENDQVPLLAIAMCEFLGIDYKIDQKDYNQTASQSYNASQIFLRNKSDKTGKVIGDVKTGVYRFAGKMSAFEVEEGRLKRKPDTMLIDEKGEQTLIMKKEAYAIDQIKNGGFLILSQRKGKYVSPNYERGRIQLKQTAFTKDGKIIYWIKQVLKGLNKYIVLKPISDEEKNLKALT